MRALLSRHPPPEVHASDTYAGAIDPRDHLGDAQLLAAGFSKLGALEDPLWDLKPAEVANAFGVRFSCI